MTHGTYLSTLNLDCETTIRQLTKWLEARELRVIRSFDLQSACASLPTLPCPHHGDSPCDCQLVILLIYGSGAVPASVVLHSHRGMTDIDLVDPPDYRLDKDLEQTIRLAFDTSLGSNPRFTNRRSNVAVRR